MSGTRAILSALGLVAVPLPLAAQTATTITAQLGVAQSLLRANGSWRGPGVAVSFHVPRTHNVDAGVEAGFFDLGEEREETQDVDPVFGPVVRQDYSEQQFGWLGLVARYHVSAETVRPMLTAGIGVYGFNQRQETEERTPAGALVRLGRFELVDLEYTPGLSLGGSLDWTLSRHLLATARLRAHGALNEGFPVVTLSVGLGYR